MVTSGEYAELSNLKVGWRQLSANVGGPVEQFEWAEACAATLSHEGLRITTVARDGRLVAVGPFAVKRIRGVHRRIMLGVDVHCEPMDLLALDADAVDELARMLARARLPLEFGHLPADSPALPALMRAFRGRRVVVTRTLPSSPYIVLDGTWEEPERHLKAGRRSDFRRAHHRAEQLGDVHAEVLVPEMDELDEVLTEAFRIEASSWKLEAGTAVLCRPEEEACIRRYAEAAAREGTLRLCFLRIGDRRVAMQIAVVVRGGFWLLKIGYDAKFARCSPGVLLVRETLAYAARAGLSTFEFLGRNEPWISRWTCTERKMVALHAYPISPRGGLALAADASFAAAKWARGRGAEVVPQARGAVKRRARPIVGRIAGRYIAGERLDDALRVADGLVAQHGAAIGFWNDASDTPREVAARYLDALAALGARGRDEYLSIKLPALDFSDSLLGEVVERAHALRVRVHLDSMGFDTVDPTRAVVEKLLDTFPEAPLGVTIPGRWERSLGDADWACGRRLPVRVVKGEWSDPTAPSRDLRAGYLDVIDALCGRAARVAVATHDTWLAAEAFRRLRSAGTHCDLELLFGLPMRQSVAQARRLGLAVRVYVPYGHGYVPYALSQLRKRPRMALWLARDLTASVLHRDGR